MRAESEADQNPTQFCLDGPGRGWFVKPSLGRG